VTDELVTLRAPPGLSVPGRGEAKRDCVVRRVAARFGWAREAHRLDRDTSGVMAVALDPETHRALSRQFHDRRPAKAYCAIVAGLVAADAGRVDLPLRADIENRPRQIVDHVHGKPAETHYLVLDRVRDDAAGGAAGRTRLALRPVTGRSHQLRVHLAALGHPVLGDDLYADPETRRASPRLLLHATALEIDDPTDPERRLRVEARCPF